MRRDAANQSPAQPEGCGEYAPRQPPSAPRPMVMPGVVGPDELVLLLPTTARVAQAQARRVGQAIPGSPRADSGYHPDYSRQSTARRAVPALTQEAAPRY